VTIAFDQHLHSRHSFDSKADPSANVQAAIVRGMKGLTFTEHFDTHPDDRIECVYDDAAYTETIDRLRERFSDRLFVGKGIEVCFQPDRMDFVLDFLDRHTFDVVLLSVHYFSGRAIHRRANWDAADVSGGIRAYFENVLAAARYCERLHASGRRVFDVLGHLDLAKRYAHRFFGAYDDTHCDGLIHNILRACVAADLVPELNTSTLRQRLDEPMPGERVVAEYARCGGTAMTVGSDAHEAEHVGADFDRAAETLAGSGIECVAVFRNRERRDERLSVVRRP
jgi:histidinol-phosphatase (PHP family)